MIQYYNCFEESKSRYLVLEYLPMTLSEVVKFLRDGGRLADLSLYCNREFNALDAQIDNMNVILTVLIDSLTRLLDLVSCERIVPIYTDTSKFLSLGIW